MSKTTNINIFDFTTEQLNYLEQEMKKYKVPFLYKIVFGSLYKVGAVLIPLLIIIIAVLGIIHNSSRFDLWDVIKGISLGTIFGIGGLVFISWSWQRLKVLKECKRLEITLDEWNTLAVAFQIKFI